MTIRVLLADDHKIMREGLKSLLDGTPEIEVAGLAANGREAVEMAVALRPDVVVMDLNMPEINGIEATRQMFLADPPVRVLILSMMMDKICILESLKAGAKGYLVKDCAGEELVGAIRALAAGDAYLCSKITGLVVNDYRKQPANENAGTDTALSHRERQVLAMIADGLNTKEIAYTLGVSIKTVEVQRGNIMKKLDLHSVAELVKYAVKVGLTSI